MGFAQLLLLFTGNAAPALAAMAQVRQGLKGLDVSRAEGATGLAGFLSVVGKAALSTVAAIAVVTAAVVGFGLVSARGLVNVGHDAYEMAQAFGLLPSQASAWVAAGAAVGVTSDQMATGFKQLSRNLEGLELLNNAAKMKEYHKELAAGTEKQRENARAALAMAEAGRPVQQLLDQLGVRAFDSAGHMRPMNDIMMDLANAFAAMPEGTDKAGIAMKLFGRSGVDMIPILDAGAAGIKGYIAQAKAMGVVLTDSQVIAAQKAYLAQQQLGLAWQGATNQLGGAFLPMLIQITTWMTGTGIPAAMRFGQWLGPHLVQAVQWARGVFMVFLPTLQAIGNFIGTNIVPNVVKLWNAFQQLLAPAIQYIRTHTEMFKDILIVVAIALGVVVGVIVVAAAIIIGAFLAITVASVWLFTKAQEVMTALPGLVQDAVIGIANFFSWLGTQVHDIIGGVLDWLVNTWNGITGTIGGFFGNLGTQIRTRLSAIVDAVTAAARAFYERPFYWLSFLFFAGIRVLGQFILGVVAWANALRERANNAAMGFIQTILVWFLRLPGELEKWAKSTLATVLKWMGEMVGLATRTVTGWKTQLLDWFTALPGRLWGALLGAIGYVAKFLGVMTQQATALVTSWKTTITGFDWGGLGRQIIEGLINGSKAMVDWAKNQLKGIGNQIVQGFKDAFGIHSPSSVMAEQVGGPIAEGVAAGISGKAHLAKGSLGSLVGGLSTAGVSGSLASGAGGNRDLLARIAELLDLILHDGQSLSGQQAHARLG